MSKKIVIYTKDHCPYCDRAKHLLTSLSLEFEVVNAEIKNNFVEMLSKSNGMRTVPQIFIGEKHIGGFEQLNQMNKNNELQNYL